MHAMDAKTQKILIQFFFDGWKFQRQCANVIDNVRLYLFFNVRKFRTPCAETLRVFNIFESTKAAFILSNITEFFFQYYYSLK